MRWPQLSTPDAPGDIPVPAYEVLKDGRKRVTTAAVVVSTLRECGADIKPVSLDRDLAPRAKIIALSCKRKPVTNGTVSRYLRSGKPGTYFLRQPFADFGLVIVCAGGKDTMEPHVHMPEFDGKLGLNYVAVVPADRVTYTSRGRTKREERPEEFPF